MIDWFDDIQLVRVTVREVAAAAAAGRRCGKWAAARGRGGGGRYDGVETGREQEQVQGGGGGRRRRNNSGERAHVWQSGDAEWRRETEQTCDTKAARRKVLSTGFFIERERSTSEFRRSEWEDVEV